MTVRSVSHTQLLYNIPRLSTYIPILQMCVPPRRLNIDMTKHLRDLVQVHTVLNQSTRAGVSQVMNPETLQPHTLKRIKNSFRGVSTCSTCFVGENVLTNSFLLPSIQDVVHATSHIDDRLITDLRPPQVNNPLIEVDAILSDVGDLTVPRTGAQQ